MDQIRVPFHFMGALLVLWLIVLPFFGCPYMAPIIERPEENVGPYVDINLVEPTPGRQISVMRDGGPISFRIPFVEDPDLDDQLVARWFVNYDRSPNLWHEQTIFPNGSLLRPGTFFDLDICRYQDLRNLDKIIVELDISDRGFLPYSPDFPFRGVPEEAKVLSVTWWLVPLETTVCPPISEQKDIQ